MSLTGSESDLKVFISPSDTGREGEGGREVSQVNRFISTPRVTKSDSAGAPHSTVSVSDDIFLNKIKIDKNEYSLKKLNRSLCSAVQRQLMRVPQERNLFSLSDFLT